MLHAGCPLRNRDVEGIAKRSTAMEIYGFTLCAVTMWLDRKLHDAFYDLEFISDDQRMLSVLFSPSMTYG